MQKIKAPYLGILQLFMFPPTQSFCNSQNRRSDVNIVLKCQPPSSLWMVAFSLIQFPLSFVPTNRCQWCPSRGTCQNHLVEWDFLEAAFFADCYCSIWMSFKIWLALGGIFDYFPETSMQTPLPLQQYQCRNTGNMWIHMTTVRTFILGLRMRPCSMQLEAGRNSGRKNVKVSY